MCDEWMPYLRLGISPGEFGKLPRNAAYRYEYYGGHAHLTPRPKFLHALLCLESIPGSPGDSEGVVFRPPRENDYPHLEGCFADAFAHAQPFAGLEAEGLKNAARACLLRTRTGGDGPLIAGASFVAERPADGGVAGAVLVTLLPGGDPGAWESYYWPGRPPDRCVELRLGRPHLTWIFVSPGHQRRGLATSLLTRAARSLRDLGFSEMASTFLLGNEASLMWHWRNGFSPLPAPGPLRGEKI